MLGELTLDAIDPKDAIEQEMIAKSGWDLHPTIEFVVDDSVVELLIAIRDIINSINWAIFDRYALKLHYIPSHELIYRINHLPGMESFLVKQVQEELIISYWN